MEPIVERSEHNWSDCLQNDTFLNHTEFTGESCHSEFHYIHLFIVVLGIEGSYCVLGPFPGLRYNSGKTKPLL